MADGKKDIPTSSERHMERIQTLTLRVGLLDIEVNSLRNEAARIQQSAINLWKLREDLMAEVSKLQSVHGGETTEVEAEPKDEEQQEAAANAFEDAVEYLDARARRHEEEDKRFYYPRSIDAFPSELRPLLSSVEAVVQVVKQRRKQRRGQKRKAEEAMAEAM